jgi:hypothetical protein
LFRKGAGKVAKLCFLGHLLMENRSGLGGRDTADAGDRLGRARSGRHLITVGADRAYDTMGSSPRCAGFAD